MLAPLAVVGVPARSNHNQLSDLDRDRPSVIGADVVRRYFSVGELSPAIALIDNPTIDFRSPAGRETIAEISRRILAVDNVAEVRSLTQALGKAPRPSADRGFLNRLAGQAISAVPSRAMSALALPTRPT